MTFILVGSTHLNFYPGSVRQTPPDAMFRMVESVPLATREAALAMLVSWKYAISEPEKWVFEIEEKPDA